MSADGFYDRDGRYHGPSEYGLVEADDAPKGEGIARRAWGKYTYLYDIAIDMEGWTGTALFMILFFGSFGVGFAALVGLIGLCSIVGWWFVGLLVGVAGSLVGRCVYVDAMAAHRERERKKAKKAEWTEGAGRWD